MPNRDGTGPEGKGPKTGRGLGPCGGGASRRSGRGRGLGLRRNAPNRFNSDKPDESDK